MNAISAAAVALEFTSNVTIAAYVAFALAHLLKAGSELKARTAILATQALVAQGVIMGLGLKSVGTVLKTIELRTWNQIGITFCVLALRLALKWHFDHVLAQNLPARRT